MIESKNDYTTRGGTCALLVAIYCCTKYCKFGKDGCSSHNIEARTVHEVVPADIQKHAGQALTDRKAMVTEFAEQISGYAGIMDIF